MKNSLKNENGRRKDGRKFQYVRGHQKKKHCIALNRPPMRNQATYEKV